MLTQQFRGVFTLLEEGSLVCLEIKFGAAWEETEKRPDNQGPQPERKKQALFLGTPDSRNTTTHPSTAPSSGGYLYPSTPTQAYSKAPADWREREGGAGGPGQNAQRQESGHPPLYRSSTSRGHHPVPKPETRCETGAGGSCGVGQGAASEARGAELAAGAGWWRCGHEAQGGPAGGGSARRGADFSAGTGWEEGRLRQGEEPLPASRCRGSLPSRLRYKTRGRHDRGTPGGLLGTRPLARRRLGSCAGCGCCPRSWPSPPPGPRPAQVTARAPLRPLGGRPPVPPAPVRAGRWGSGCGGAAAAAGREGGRGGREALGAAGRPRAAAERCVHACALLRALRGLRGARPGERASQ